MIVRNTVRGNSGTVPAKPAPALKELCRTFYRHKRKMAAVFCVIFVLLAVGVVAFPRTYTSDARLFIRLGRESVALDPTATMNEVINVNDSRESEINSELEILRSRVLLEDVVERLGPNDVLSRSADNSQAGTIVAQLKAARTWLSGDISLAERAVTKLEKSIEISSPRKSNVLRVTCKAGDPKQAQRILQAFLDSYMIRHAEANRTQGSHEFFADQSEILRVQLAKADADLSDAKNRIGMASVDGQRENVEEQANIIEVAVLENQLALSSSEEKIAALEKMLVEMPEQELAEESMIPSEAFDAMRHELYKVQILEKEASSRYTDLHPNVIALRHQVEETRKILASEEANRNHPTHKLSVVRQAVQIDLAATKASVAAQKAEAAVLKQQLEGVASRIRALNDSEFRIRELSREAELLEASYRTYTTNREQARIHAALEAGRISNVNVVQPASFVAKASSPNLRLALALTLVLATLASVLVALVSEHFDQSLKSPEQTEQELGVPVLFSVPRGALNVLAEKQGTIEK